MIAELPFEILVLRRQRQLRLHSLETNAKETLQELSPSEVFERRLAVENWDGEIEQKKKARITQVFNEVLDSVINRNTDAGKEVNE